ncbi:MAG: Holliday junction resolvase RuvX [Myxococcota bacterium]
MRVIGLDVGTQTIGVAATDPLGMLAHPVCTVSRKGVKQDVAVLQRILDEQEATAIVVGLPYELDGSEARSARLARQIGDALGTSSGLSVQYVDERFSSVEAERRMIESGTRRKKRQEIIDQIAAVVILETWLAMNKEPR